MRAGSDMPLIRFSLVILLLSLSACGMMQPKFDKPMLTLVNIQPLAAEGLEQRARLRLKLKNPQPYDFSASGVAIILELNDLPVLTGVSNELPVFAAYSEGMFDVDVSSNLFTGMRLLAQVLGDPQAPVEYEVRARFSLDTFPKKTIKINRKGELNLNM